MLTRFHLTVCLALAALGFGTVPDARAATPVSFHREVMPILRANCMGCHKPGKLKGKLDLTTFAGLVKGGKKGLSLTPGHPQRSRLVTMISGDTPDMPEDDDPLPAEQVELIRRWVEQGAKDDTPDPALKKIKAPVYELPPVVPSIAFSPDGKILAVAGYHEVLLHEADGSGLVARLVGVAPRIESIVFSADGKQLGVCGGSPGEFGHVQIWDVSAAKLHKAYRFSYDSLFGLSFAPDGKTVAFGGADKVVRRINIEDGKELLIFKAHSDWVLGTVFTVDGKKLVSGGRDKALKLIDLATERFEDDVNNPLEEVISLDRHPSKDMVAYGGGMGTPRIYRISVNLKRTAARNDTNLVRAFERQPAAVHAIAFSGDGNRLAVGSVGETRIYDANNGKRLLSLAGQEGPVYGLDWGLGDKILATAGYDGPVRLFDANTGKLVRSFIPVPIQKPVASARADR